MQTVDHATVMQQFAERYPHVGLVALPPLAPSGRCGICGEFVPDPATAPHGVHIVPPSADIGVDILLCADHAGGK